MLALLSSCTGTGEVTTAPEVSKTEAPAGSTEADDGEYLLCGVPLSEYTIVIPKNADNDEKYAAKLISERVLAETGIKLTTAKSAEGRGIIIENTENANSYTFGMEGDNVILGGAGGLTVKAARILLDRMFPSGAETFSLELGEAESIPFERLALPELTDFGTKPIALADQKNDLIAVYDIASGEAELKYEFKPKRENGFSLNGYGNRVDEARLRYSAEWGTYIIGFTSSSGYAAIASYPDGKCLWQIMLGSSSPHTIEYIPGGYIAVANSGGSDTSKGVIRIYPLESKKYGYARLTSAHGLLWDETRELLWALGSNDIVAYEIGGTLEEPELIKVPYYGTDQMQGGHDLSAIPGDDDRVWVGGSFVRIFDKTTGELIDSYPGSTQISRPNVKCICAFPDGTAALTVATGVYASHDTDRFILYTFGLTVATPTEFVFDGRAFYKARAFIAEYN